MKSSRVLRSVQIALTLFLIGSQFGSPLAVVAQARSVRRPAASMRDAAWAASSVSPPSLAALDAQFVQLLSDYVNAPPAATASVTLQQGYHFAQALHLHAMQRELAQKRGAGVSQPIVGLTPSQVNAAFMRLLGAYLSMPADMSAAARTRYEDAFASGFQILALRLDSGQALRLSSGQAPQCEGPVPTAGADASAATQISWGEAPILSPPSVPPTGGEDRSRAPNAAIFPPSIPPIGGEDQSRASSPAIFPYSVPVGGEDRSHAPDPTTFPPLGGIEGGALWSLESSDSTTGQAATWEIAADPANLAAFDAAFTQAMHAPAAAEAETQRATAMLPQSASRSALSPAAGQDEVAWTLTPPLAHPATGASETVFAAPVPSHSRAPLHREGGVAGFVAHNVTNAADAPISVYATDVDGDGDTDLVSASMYDNTIAWHENDGATSPGFTSHTIATNAVSAWSVYAADVNGDGHMDVLSASFGDDKVAWYENDGASPPNFTAHNIDTNAGGAVSVFAIDMDRDGDMDVLSANQNDHTVAWYENNDLSFTAHIITDYAMYVNSVFAADMDNDGDIDVLSAALQNNEITLYSNTGHQTFNRFVISDVAVEPYMVYAADVNGDGDMDILSASNQDDKIAWYENSGALIPNFTERVITTAADHARTVHAADVDKDGDIDVLSNWGDTVAWYENDGAVVPTFITHTLTAVGSGCHSVYVADVDGDGDMDIPTVFFNDDTIAWYENRTIHYSADFPTKAVIAPVSTNYGYQSLVADLDNDADLDVLFSTYENDHEITWYENGGGAQPAFTMHAITGVGAWGVNDFCVADVNSDGYADIVSTESDDLVVWYENNKATPPSFTAHSYATSVDEPENIFAADLDSDGDMDLLSNAYPMLGLIVWYENDGNQAFTEHTLDGSNDSHIFELVDMNRDGHLDLITSEGSDSIAWHQNDGSQTFTKYVVPTSFSGLVQVNAIDMDSDGDMDFLASFTWDDTLAWYENIGGEPLSFTEHIVTSTADGIRGISAADVDSDGDIDVLAEVISPWRFVLYENDGAQIFTAHNIETPVYSDVSVADLNGDGDLDVFFGDPELVWYENTGGQFKLETVATAPAVLGSSQITDVLQITMTHRGRAGDDGAELATLGLRFTDASSIPLTTAQANALFDTLYLYVDDGSGVFEAANDTLITTVTGLTLSAAGQLTLTMPDGDPNVAVDPGTSRTFFVALKLAADAGMHNLHNLQLTHVNEGAGRSTAQDRTFDTALALESPADITTTLFIDSNWSHTIGDPGLDGDVNAVVIDGTDVYAGGSFTGTVARWNGSAWSALGSLDGDVHALVISGTTLYAGGAFTGHLARWNGSAWETVGGGLDATVYALAADDGALYAGGDFTGAGGVPDADHIARWDGSAWHALDSGANGMVRAIALDGADVYIGGSFTNPAYPYVARWDGSTWHAVGGAVFGDVYALSVVGFDLYAGGDFDAKIARWDGSAWHEVGGGLDGFAPFVKALATNGSDLYVGGVFTGTSGISTPNIARWNGFGWSDLNWGTNGTVNALAVGNNGPVVGGAFTAVDGDVPANKVAAWEPPLTDLTLSHTVAPTATAAGGTLTYTLTLTNNSALTATNVTLRDTLPDGLNLLAQSDTCTATGQIVTCTLGSLVPGATQSLTLTVATAIANGIYTNVAMVSADQPESDGTDNVASAPPVTVTIESDLALAKAGPAGVVAGRDLTYTLVVTNYGPNPAPAVVLTDHLPAGLGFLAATPGCSGASGAVTCTLGDLPIGVTRTVTLTAGVPAALSAGTVTNTAGVTSGALDPVPGNHSAQAATWVSVEADLGGAFLAPPSVCISGTLYTTLIVSNTGPSLATGVSLSNPLSAGTTFVSASAACTHDGGTPGQVTCAVGDLPPGARRTYTVALGLAGFSDFDLITHHLSVTASSPDPTPADNTAVLTTTIRTDCSTLQADLSLVKAAPATVAAGGWVTYTLAARNYGSRGATGVRLSDNLPAGVSFEAAASDPACTAMGNVVCTVGALAAGQFRNYTLVGRVAVDTPFGTPLTNTATISGAEADFLPDNNQDSAVSTVILESDLALSKTAPVTASTGVPMVYTLTVTNNGPSHAAGLVLSDTLPPGVLYNAANASQGTCVGDDEAVTCTLGALNAQASASVFITVTPFQGGNLVNAAQIAAATPDPTPGNDSANVITTIATGAGRETRTYGYLRVTANAFMDAGGSAVQALGDIWLGAVDGAVQDPIILRGDADMLIIDSASDQASGNGTVTLREGDQQLFSGDFTVDGTLSEPLLFPGHNLDYTFDALADFEIDAGLTVTDTNLGTGGTRGHAMLAVQSQALSKTLQADFEILPGPEYVATLEPFAFTLAGMTVTVSAPQLGNTGIGAEEVALTLPAHLGGASATVAALRITPDSLSFGDVGATFPLPDIKFGSGEKAKIVDAAAGLLYMRTSDAFAFTASGTLSLTMPSNQQAIALDLRVDTEGNLSARLDQVRLKVAGGNLQLQDILIDNSGLAVANAILTLPPSFKGATATLSDVAITGDGLHIGGAGATFSLPDLKIGSGKKVKFVELCATLEIANLTGGDQEYTFGIQGEMQLRLPQNAQDIQFTAQLDSSGAFNGTLDQLRLTMAGGKATLQLEDIAFDSSGLDVATGTLTLSLGGTPATGTVTGLRIDDSGLSVGGGSVTVAVPDIKVGSGKNFSLTGATVKLELGGDRSYKLTLAGTMEITIPGAHSSATASISVDGDGQISGSLQSFALTVAGLGLAIDNAILKDGVLLVDRAAIEIPPQWGGLKAELYQLRIGGSSGLSIGGGKFALPDMKVGKLTLAGLEGGFVPVAGGYEISAQGLFKVPALGGGPNCGIKVGVTLYAEGGRSVMAIHTLEPPDTLAGRPLGLARPAGFVQPDDPLRRPDLSDLALKNVTCGLEGCRIPIGATGFFLSRVEGELTLDEGTTHVDLGVTIITGFGLGTIPAVAGDADLGIDFDPFQMDFSGAVTLFAIFKAAELDASIRSGFFSAELRINQIWPPLRGEAGLTAWTTDGDFHLVGHASLSVGFKKGQLWHGCVDLLLDEVCVNVPPVNTRFGGIHTEFGEFRRGSGTTWGLKGWVGVHIPWPVDEDVNIGFYFDAEGDLDIGNVNGYRTITPPSVARARALWKAQRDGRPMTALSTADQELLTAYHFDPYNPATVETDVTIATRSDVLFYMARTSVTPTMALVDPTGTVITPGNLPSNVGYEAIQVTRTVTTPVTRVVTDTQVMYGVKDADPGTWRIRLTGEPAEGEGYIVDVLGIVPQPVLGDLSVVSTGPTGAQVGWRLSTVQPTTTLAIYATPGPISTTFGVTETVQTPLFSGFPITTDVTTLLDGTPQSAALDLSGLESGVYHVWFDANDGRNPPVRVYAPSAITVTQSWQTTWTANLQAIPGFRTLALDWDASPHPDVDSYTVYLSTEPIVPMAGQALAVGDLLSTTLHSLTPDQTYYLTLGAVDEDTGRVALSESITATPLDTPFALSAATTEWTLVSGDAVEFDVDVTTTWPDYPGVVSLRAGDLPDGVGLRLSQDIVTPTVEGVSVGVTLSTTARLPGGVYTATVHGVGAGLDARLPFTLTVQEPTFTLSTPPAVTLHEGESAALVVAAQGVHGASDPIYLSLDGAPPGLLTAWEQRTLAPGASASLFISDTALLNHGVYTLTVSGEDGRNTAHTETVLNVVKPGFALNSARLRRIALHGETVTHTLDLSGFLWPHPVRVALDDATLVPGSVMGLRLSGQAALSEVLTVTVPAQIALVTQVTSATLPGQYWSTIRATSQDKQDALELALKVYETATTADLAVDVPDGPMVMAGTSYVYTATLTNQGPLTATDVVLTDTLPAAWVSLVGVTPSQGQCSSMGGAVTCTLGDLTRDAQAHVRVELAVSPATPEGTQLVSRARVRTATAENSYLDNSGTGVAWVHTEATLALQAAVTPDPVALGQALAYSLTLTNHGPSDASEVQLSSSLPEHTEFVAASSDCRHTLGRVTCALDRLAAGSDAVLTFTTRIDPGAALGILSGQVTAAAANGKAPAQAAVGVTLVDQAIVGLAATAGGRTRLGHATTLTASVDQGTRVTCRWDPGDGQSSQGGTQVQHTYANVGSYNVTVTATNSAHPAGVVTTTVATVYADYVWNGGWGAGWGEVQNWAPFTGQAPTRYDNVTLPAQVASQVWPVLGSAQVNDLYLEPGSELTLADGARLTVEDKVSNHGVLRQTVNRLLIGSPTHFLHLQNAAGNVDQYWGVDVHPSAPLGPVTVAVTGHAACPGVTGPTVLRCFDVATEGNATLTFHYRESERNGLDAAQMRPWRWQAASGQWELMPRDLIARDSQGPDYALTVADVAEPGLFVLRPGNVAPVADDDAFRMVKDSDATVLDVLAGDTDADGDGLRVYAVGSSSHGGVLVNAEAHVTYAPPPGFAGTDTFTYTVSDGFSGFATAQVSVVVTETRLYLPLLMRGYVPLVIAPDLVVEDLVATPDGIQVTVTNQGHAPVQTTEEFFMQVYIAPDPAPSAVNQLWYELGDQGLFWGVTSDLLPLDPGESLTLTSGDAHYMPGYSRVTWPLAVGTAIYAQVDAYNGATTFGAVRETHEIREGVYNNVAGPVYVTDQVTMAAPAETPAGGPTPSHLPDLPRP